MKLSVKWLKGAKTQEQRKEVMAKVLAAKPAFSLLADIIKEEIELNNRSRIKKDMYKDSNWGYFQADSIGEERALRSILKTISIKEEDLND